MGAPDAVKALVETFAANRAAFMNPAYNETQVRREFIDPFFKALGWDIDNSAGNAPQYRDVVHEDAIKVGIDTRAPDYSFRIGGVRKFFVEAKKPAVNLRDDPSSAYQLRRYAWSAKLPLSVLTDFQEFVVYDCRVKPDKNDKASVARILYATFDEYDERWDEIADIFSRDAILKGRFDTFAEAKKAKRGTAEVDTAFLKEIETWRDELARNIALRNRSLSQRELNYVVQATIDRIIFLRICEDRGIEPYGRLRGLVNGGQTYSRLCNLFAEADHRYNSGLFHFEQEKGRSEAPDSLALGLTIDDKVLKDMLRRMYYPESPYEFSVLPADILGQVYEQFLGKVIRLTDGHQAKIEDKLEVKKAGGVYYTPTYIVDYIVKNTVGRLLEGLAPKQAADLRILDPACGSGSFLIGAYQYLLDWHRDWYAQNDPEKHKKAKAICEGRGGEWRLTTAERKRILLNNIYGVDIDAQAVETTKLSLLLKVLEGENSESLNAQTSLIHERALPDLAANIKCGNSLIGPDFYADQQLGMSLFDDEERYRINVFDWEAEFPQILGKAVPEERRAFDAVIGNPPYIRIHALRQWAPREADFYRRVYQAAERGNYDIYVVFIERGLSLLSARGQLGFIVPHKFFNSQYGEPLRELLSSSGSVREIVHFRGAKVFSRVSTYSCLLFLSADEHQDFRVIDASDIDNWIREGDGVTEQLAVGTLGKSEWNFVLGREGRLFKKLDAMPRKLRDVVDGMFVGQQTSADPVYVFTRHRESGDERTTDVWSDALSDWITVESAMLKKVVRSGAVGQYWCEAAARVLFPYTISDGQAMLLAEGELAGRYPLTWSYLGANKRALQGREGGKFADSEWYRFGRSQNLGAWETPKVLVPYMVRRLSACLDDDGDLYFVNVTTGGYGLTVRQDFGSRALVCGLLNSPLLDFYFKRVSTDFQSGYHAANKQFIELLPICSLESPVGDVHVRVSELENLVHAVHAQTRAERLARTADDRKRWARLAADSRRRLDHLVYELYGLTDEEIALVEENTPSP